MSDAGGSCKRAPGAPRPARGALKLLDPATPTGAALRTAVACTIAMALALSLHVEVPALAVVFVLARGNAGAVTMLAGGLGGAAAALVLLDVFDQSAAGMSAALLVLTTLATYLSLGGWFPYAFVQGLLILLVLIGQGLDAPGAAVRHAFYDLTSVALAALAAFLAGASQPVAVPAQLQAALAAQLRACAALLRRDGAWPAACAVRLEVLARRRDALLAIAWPTRLVSLARRRALAAAAAAVEDVVRRALALHALASAPRGPAERAEVERLVRELGAAAGCVADVLPAVRGPVDDGRSERRERARAAALVARRAALGAPAHLTGVAALAAELGRRLARLAAASTLLVPGAAAGRGGSGRPRRRRVGAIDRFRLRHAVKSAASYLVVLWAWVASEWGAIVPALVVSVLVATLATPLGATLRKAALRVGGVLAGGVVGLAVAIVLLPRTTSLPAICAVTGLGLAGFLWVQQRHERLTFAALQAAIAFALTLVHGPGPDPTSRGPVDSLIGLAFGISVVVLVMHAVWPLDAASSARRALAELAARAGARLAAPGADAGGDPAAREARLHAAGFVHEVELYGAQFGRPADDLAELFLLVVEIDALASSPAICAASRGVALEAFAEAAARSLQAAAAALAALPGEGRLAALAASLPDLHEASRGLAARRAHDDAPTALRGELACALAALVQRLADELQRGDAGAVAVRRAA